MKRFAPFVLVFAASASFAPPARAQFVIGDLYVADSNGNLVHRIEPGSWNVTTFADFGDGLNIFFAMLLMPAGTLPSDPAYNGFELDLQAVEADPGAVEGFSFTQGLQLLLGW